MATTITSGIVSLSPAAPFPARRSIKQMSQTDKFQAKSRRRSPTLPVVSATLSHIEADTTTTLAPRVFFSEESITKVSLHNIYVADLDPGTAKVAISIIGPALSAFGFLFILRIVMSWYPKLPVDKFPYVLAYAPTEPILVQTRKVIPPLAGVDVTPVVWFGLVSFLSEILVGPQGLLVLVSQQRLS